MDEIEQSLQRHPAGKLKSKGEAHDLSWALANAMKQGALFERERIIKLLEECLDHDYDVPSKDGWSGDMLHVDVFCTACRAVALIKGEK